MGHRVHTSVRMYAIWSLLSKSHKQRLCPESSGEKLLANVTTCHNRRIPRGTAYLAYACP